MNIRINGLVRFFNHVRLQLQTGLAPDEVEAFKRQVRKVVGDVETICRSHGATPDRLPAPSRRVYLFLRDLDLDHLPMRQAGEPVAAKTGFRIKNVVKIGENFADRLWQRLDSLLNDPPSCTQLIAELERQTANIEQICAEFGQTPSALESPSRRVYTWMKFLAEKDQLAAHLATLEIARKIACQIPIPAGKPLLLHLVNLNNLWRRRDYQNTALLKVHAGFQNADRQVWQALLQCSLGQSSADSERLYRSYAESEDFNETLFELESFAAPPVPLAQGHVHDLDESFARVNAGYFGGLMPKPKLIWNRTLTARTFGYYKPGRDTIMISITLDAVSVPTSLVDYVMYHELLHKKHGVMLINGRRVAHSHAFLADERRFAGYDEAERQLHALALRQRGVGASGGDDEEE